MIANFYFCLFLLVIVILSMSFAKTNFTDLLFSFKMFRMIPNQKEKQEIWGNFSRHMLDRNHIISLILVVLVIFMVNDSMLSKACKLCYETAEKCKLLKDILCL